MKFRALMLLTIMSLYNSCTTSNFYDRALKKSFSSIASNELRALWIVRDWIREAASIDRVLENMSQMGLNTAIVQVRGLSDAFYRSKYEEPCHECDPSFDSLKYFLEKASEKNIKVHAWVNVFLAAKEVTRDSRYYAKHLMQTHPEWFLKDRSGRSMLDYSQKELDELWIDGYYLDPANEDVQDYLMNVFKDILKKYQVDGLHLDFIRYPYSRNASTHDFGLNSLNKKNTSMARESSSHALDQLPQNIARAKEVTRFVSRLRLWQKKEFPQIELSAAVWAHKKKTVQNVFQDWGQWLERDFIDRAYMMIYVKSKKTHRKRVLEFYTPELKEKIVFGVGLYRNPSFSVVEEQVKSSRALKAGGFALFSSKWLDDNRSIPKKWEKMKNIVERNKITEVTP